MSSELLSSKVVVQEEAPRVRRIPGLPTAVLGMVAITERGPIGVATLTTSFAEWRRIFGGPTANADGFLAAQGYYEEGGTTLYTVRTVHYTDISSPATSTAVTATVTLVDRAGSPLSTLAVDGKTPGAYGNDVKAIIDPPTNGETDKFNLLVEEDGVIVEVFPNVSMTDADARFVETVVNDAVIGSNLIAVTDLDSATATPGDLPALGTFSLTTGDDGLTALADIDFVGDAAGKTGLRALDLVQTLSLLIVPAQATAAVHVGMITYAETTRDLSVFAILDPPAAATAAGIVTYVDTTANLLQLSEFAAIYWPRVKIVNPSKAVFGNTDDLTVAPSGIIAGRYARVDASSPGGVHVPPAGIDNGRLTSVIGLETDEVLDEGKRDLVFPKLINPITTFPGAPIFLDGARTLRDNSNFPTVGERRGAIFIEQSIKGGVQFARHRRNTERLRGEVDRTVEAFMLVQVANEAFASQIPSEAFFLDFDVPGVSLNSPDIQFVRQLRGRVGLATAKPAEFIILLFSQDTRALEQALAAS